ncbi:MAG: DnaT-like ssDNA-binding domain-containing protein [Gammaproteobacteria bacterium]|nr:DnaT-like ssDNA-binding domain-containing protein [Gammaproteobacteria bacterium]
MPLSAPSLPIIPQFAQRYGLEQALMLAVVAELVGSLQGHVVVEEQRLYSRALCLSRVQQGQLLSQLSSLGLLQVAPAGDGLVRISLELIQPNEAVPHVIQPAIQKSSMSGFGGWHRADGEGDELSRLFAAKEAQQQHLCHMDLEWKPSANIVKVLAQQHQISEAFAIGIKDEFVVYYMDKGRKQTPGGWDQKFLKWVKKEQVQQQTAQARAQRQTQQQTHSSNEEARYAAKERRRNITANVLDINNTDW